MTEEKTRARKKEKEKIFYLFLYTKPRYRRKKDCIDGRINRIEKREKKINFKSC